MNFPVQGLRGKLVLTYDNTKIPDGAGAQLQRIYGTYAIARLLGVAYLHTPIHHIVNQGLSSWERNVVDPDYHRPFNDLFHIPSDAMPAEALHEVEMGNIHLETLDRLSAAFDAGESAGRPYLARAVVPYGIADRFPDCYEACKTISPFAATPRAGRPLRVALHVRRGELLVVAKDRVLSDAYYVSVAQQLGAALAARGIEYQVEIHTEAAVGQFTVQPGYPGTSATMTPTVITPEMCRMDAFNVLPNLVYCINDDPIDCLRKLATADVLVMSRSSFSYVGAILNRTGVVLYHPFWHSALSSWLTVDPDGQFDRSRFDALVENRWGGSGGAALRDRGGESQVVTLPPHRYLALGSLARAMFLDGLEEAFSADMICLFGWRAPDGWGVAADGPEATLRFRVAAPVGAVIHLVMRLTAAGSGPCRIRIVSGSGAQTERVLASKSNGSAILSCVVEPEHFVTVRMSTAEPTHGGSADAPSFGLKGLLYVYPDEAMREAGDRC